MIEALFAQLEDESLSMSLEGLKDWMTRPDQFTPEKTEFDDKFTEEWE